MKWGTLLIGAVALAVMFAAAHQGVEGWFGPGAELQQRRATADLLAATRTAAHTQVAQWVQGKEDLLTLAADRLSRGQVRPERVLDSLQDSGATGLAVVRAGNLLAKTGTISAPASPTTELGGGGLTVVRRLGPWTVAGVFAIAAFSGVTPLETGLVSWKAKEQVLARLGPPRLVERASRAKALGGYDSAPGPVPGTTIEVVIAVPSSDVLPRAREGIVWLGVGSLGVFVLTLMLMPAGSSRARGTAAGDAAPATVASASSASEPSVPPQPERAAIPEIIPEADPAPPTALHSEPGGAFDSAGPGTGDLDEPLSARPEQRMDTADVAGAGPLDDPSGLSGDPADSDDDGDDDGWSSALPSAPETSAVDPAWSSLTGPDSGIVPIPGPPPESADALSEAPAVSDEAAPEKSSEAPPPLADVAAPVSALEPAEEERGREAAEGDEVARASAPTEVWRAPATSLTASLEEVKSADVPTPSVPPPARMEAFDASHYREVFDAFVAARARVGDPATSLSFAGFQRKLETSERALIEKHGCRAVRFQVVERERKVTLRPQLVR